MRGCHYLKVVGSVGGLQNALFIRRVSKMQFFSEGVLYRELNRGKSVYRGVLKMHFFGKGVVKNAILLYRVVKLPV